MAKKNRTSCMIIALLLSGIAPALAQTAPSMQLHVPLQKEIGQSKPEIVPSLIVMNARGGLASIMHRVGHQAGTADEITAGKDPSQTRHLTGIDRDATPRIKRDPFQSAWRRKRGWVKSIGD